MTTFLAGQKVTAADLNNINPPFQSFTPTNSWSGAGSPVCRYTRHGDLIIASYDWTLSGAPSGGTLSLGAPVNPKISGHPIGIFCSIGIATIWSVATCRSTSSGFVVINDAGSALDSGTAGVGSGDFLNMQLSYEPAA